MYHKKFINMFVSISVVILLIIASFNYFVDPANLFHKKNVDYAVDNMVNGKGVVNLINMDERYFMKQFIVKSNVNPDVIVLGSSRSMGIKKDFLKDCDNFSNYSVSGAGIKDYISLWYVFKSHFKQNPDKIILGIDPWVLNDNNGDERWRSLSQEYYQASMILNLDDTKSINQQNLGILKKCRELFSIKYFKESIRLRKSKIFPKAVNSDSIIDEDIIMPDGSRKYGSKTNSIDKDTVDKRVIGYIENGNIYQLNGYESLDKDKINKFISYLQKENIEIIFYLPPYHPKVYSYISSNSKYKNVENAELFLRNIALKYKIKLYGSYNPKKCGVDLQDFTDGMHMKTSGYQKIFFDKI